MVLSNERLMQGEILRLLGATTSIIAFIKIAYVEKDDDQVVKCIKAFLLHREASIAICCLATLDLHSDLRFILCSGLMPWIRMDTDQVIPFVSRWSFIRQDVTPHQVSHHQVL